MKQITFILLILTITLSCSKMDENIFADYNIEITHKSNKRTYLDIGDLDTLYFNILYKNTNLNNSEFIKDGGHIQLATSIDKNYQIINLTERYIVIRATKISSSIIQINAYHGGNISYDTTSINVQNNSIVYESNGDLFRIKPDGDNLTNLTNTPLLDEKEPSQNFNGNLIAYKLNNNILIKKNNSNEIRKINKFTNAAYKNHNFVLDDTNTISFIRDQQMRYSDYSDNEITLYDNDFFYSTDLYINSTTNKKWAFIEIDKINVVNGSENNSIIFNLNSYNISKPCQDIQLSPDNKLITFSDGRDIYIGNISLKQIIKVTKFQGDNVHPSFNSSSDKIVFSSSRNGNFDLYIYDLINEISTQLTNTSIDELNPDWK